MSKITFRADDKLVERLEAFDASKSEVMRNALRHYLDTAETDAGDDSSSATTAVNSSIDQLIDARIDRAVDARVSTALADRRTQPEPPSVPDVTLNLTLSGISADDARLTTERKADDESAPETNRDSATSSPERKTADADRTVRAPPASHTEQTCTQCGETVSSDHVYCPNCGEKASHTPVCECGEMLSSDWAFCPDCGRRTPAADVLE